MKSLPVLIAFVLLSATSFDVCAQSAAQTVPTGTDVGHTGTDTATVPTDSDVGHTGTDTATVPTDSDVGHTGTDTATVPQSTDVGHTGPDTRTPSGPSPWTLSAESSSVSSPGSVVVTVTMPAGAGPGGSYTVPLVSSNPACVLPESVSLDWTSDGGTSSFTVDCAKVAKRTTVTITGGTASTSFTLK